MSWGKRGLWIVFWGLIFPLSSADAADQTLACLPILCYHQVSAQPLTEYGVSGADFRAQMDYLKEKGYATIPLSRWIQARKGAASLPPRPVILTFDDGYSSAYTEVFPLLLAHGFTGTFFISTQYPGQPSHYLTSTQLREMARAGMEIMPHGHSHANLVKRKADETQGRYRARVRRELTQSRSLLEARLRRPCPFFAYPYGAYDQEVEEIAKEAHFELILTACPGTNTPKTHLFRLKRQFIYRDDGLEGFRRKLEALPLEAQFPFAEGAVLSRSPQEIVVGLPRLDCFGISPLLLLDRREVASSYDATAFKISYVPPAPLQKGLHLLEVRIIEKGSGRWYQDSTLFAVRPTRGGISRRDEP